MRILIPCAKDFIISKRRNPFVRIINDGLIENGFDVVCDYNELWKENLCYDGVFFQWPEAAFDWANYNTQLFEQKLVELRKGNIKIIATCHNLQNHYNNTDANKLYDILYTYADAIHHLGNYSFQLFKTKYPNCYHFISQHPIFYDIKAMKLNQKECRGKLGLPLDKKIILAFGIFRNDDEIRLFTSLRKEISSRKVILVAPRLSTGRLNNGRHITQTMKCIYKRTKYKLQSIIYDDEYVDEDMIPYYFTACDVIFIQRKEILNSGNLPLAFSAGKIVVGPNKGNVGDILSVCGNPCFNPDNIEDVISKTKMALEMSISNDIGIKNYTYSQNNMQLHITNNIISKEIWRLLTVR